MGAMLLTTTHATVLPVTLDEAKVQCRVDGADEDAYITALIARATGVVEGATGLRLAPVSLEWRGGGWCWPVVLQAAPVRDVTELRYLDDNDVEQVLADADWYWLRTLEGAEVRLVSGVSAPAISCRPDAVRVAFEAGADEPGGPAGPAADTRPDPRAVHAVLLLTAHYYENREAVTVGAAAADLPTGFHRLVEQLRVRW